MSDIAWVNGVITSLDDAKVSFLDRGYLFGDGVYEVLKVCNSRIFAIKEHLDRLDRSMEAIRIRPTWNRSELDGLIRDLAAKSELLDARIYIQVTRGVGPRKQEFSSELTPTLAIFIAPLQPFPEETRKTGVKAITVADERWAHPHIKTLNLLPNVLARQQAEEAGAFEAILIRDGGLVTECSSSNVFAVINDTIITPPTDGRILPGVTRDLLLRAAREANYSVKEDYLVLPELQSATEIFITNTGVEILGVVELDSKLVGNGAPGRITEGLYQLFVSRWLNA
jgi:D-alanine transaminase